MFFNFPKKIFNSINLSYTKWLPILSQIILFIFAIKEASQWVFLDHLLMVIDRPNLRMAFVILGYILSGYIFIGEIYRILDNHSFEEKYNKLLGKYSDLRESLKILNVYKTILLETHETLLTGELHQIAKVIFNEYPQLIDFNNDRFSLYIYKPHSNKFQLFARFSDNPVRADKGTRIEFDPEGIIGQVWKHNHCKDLGSSNIVNHSQDEADFVDYHFKKFKIKKDTLRKIRFKAISYIGIRINDAQNRPKAVLLLESSKKYGRKNANRICDSLTKTANHLSATVCNLFDIIINKKIDDRIKLMEAIDNG